MPPPLAGFLEVDEGLLLFMLERVGGALGDEAHSDAAFDLFLMLTAAMKASDKPLLMEMGFRNCGSSSAAVLPGGC